MNNKVKTTHAQLSTTLPRSIFEPKTPAFAPPFAARRRQLSETRGFLGTKPSSSGRQRKARPLQELKLQYLVRCDVSAMAGGYERHGHGLVLRIAHSKELNPSKKAQLRSWGWVI